MGIAKLNTEGSSEIIFRGPVSREYRVEAIILHGVVVSGRRGIGIVDTDRGYFGPTDSLELKSQ